MSNLLAEIRKKIKESKIDGQLLELDLSDIAIGKFTSEIAALIEKEKKLEVLLLKNCGLTSLANLPKNNLQAIDLSENHLDDSSQFEVLANYPELTQIFASKNKLANKETLLKLKDLPKLIDVSFENNPICEAADYAKDIFDNFPAMQYVDGKDVEGNPAPEEEEELDGDEEDDEEEYEEEDDEEFDEEEDYEEESDEKPKKNKKRK